MRLVCALGCAFLRCTADAACYVPQGCGIVEFETPDQAQRAIQMFNGQQVGDWLWLCVVRTTH